MTNKRSLQAAREYREFITRWYVAKRNFPGPHFDSPKPQAPPGLSKETARIMEDEIERDVNRRIA